MLKYLHYRISTFVGVAIIVGVAVFTFGGFFVYQYFAISKLDNIEVVQTEEDVNNLRTADWKTYSNDEYGFEIKYPGDWSAESFEGAWMFGEDILFTLLIDENPISDKVYGKEYSKEVISDIYLILTIQPNPCLNTYCYASIARSFNVGEINGTYIPGIFHNISFPSKDNLKMFSMNLTQDDPHSGLAHLMLSTFKLTDTFKIDLVKDTFKIDWVTDKDYSDHVGSKKAIFIIKQKDGFIGYTKTLIWPVVKNIPDTQVLEKINNILDFDEITGGFDEFRAENIQGLRNTNFEVNYDKNNVLSLTLYREYLGAYSTEFTTNIVINLISGEVIKPSDIFYQSRISNLIDNLNIELQNRIEKGPTGPCSREEVEYELRRFRERDQGYGSFFTEKNITNLKINLHGITFIYYFGFDRWKICEPDGEIFMSYEQLKSYIRPDGLLGGEVI